MKCDFNHALFKEDTSGDYEGDGTGYDKLCSFAFMNYYPSGDGGLYVYCLRIEADYSGFWSGYSPQLPYS